MAGSWRLAKSLETLRTQLNEAHPNRSKASDGTIGDQSHAATWSDHNPNKEGVVCAFDITHDPVNGLDAHQLADTLIENPHPNLKYVISNSRIAGDFTDWNWGWYAGINPHSSHIHVSVGIGPDGQSKPPYDDTTKWNIKEEQMDYATAVEIARGYGLLAHMEEKDITAEWLDYHAKNIVANPPYAIALWQQLKSNDPWSIANWKYVHFDSEVKKSYEKGKSEGGNGEFVKASDLYIRKNA